MKFFGQLFDAPAEIVVAQGRVILAALSLVAITIDPTDPPGLVPFVTATLVLYACYSVGLLALLHWRFVYNLSGPLIHAIDMTVLALLLFLTQGFSSPFLVFFTFALIAASLRWDWQGIALTMAVLILIAGFVAMVDFAVHGQLSNLKEGVIRAAYLLAVGAGLSYASAHREHERGRLLKLALWPTAPGEQKTEAVAEILGQAVKVLDAFRAVIIWEQVDDPAKVMLAIWQNEKCQIREISPDSIPLAVVPALEGLTFSRTQPDLHRLNMINGSMQFEKEAFVGDLLSELAIADFSTSPFVGSAARGRIFIIGNIRPSDDHLPITQIIADRVGAELDRQIFAERTTQDVVLRERAAIMRDLHDGLLQSLTAARIQLEQLPTGDAYSSAELGTVRELLRVEQRRFREFVDSGHAKDNELKDLEALRASTEQVAQLWGCRVELSIPPSKRRVSRSMFNQLSLMMAEGVANAVRHGEATRIHVAVTTHDHQLSIEFRDDGHGFPAPYPSEKIVDLAQNDLPRSLNERVRALGGRLQGYTSGSGAILRLDLPS